MAFTGHSKFYSLTLLFCLWISFGPSHAQGDRDRPFGGLISRFVQLPSVIRDRSSDIAAIAIKPLTDGSLRPFFPHRQHHHGLRNKQNSADATTTTVASSPEPSTAAPVASEAPPSTAAPVASEAPPSTAAPVASQAPPSSSAPEASPATAVTSAPPLENKPSPSTEDWSHVLPDATEAGKPKPESITRKIINLPCRGLTARDGSCRQPFD